MANAILSVAAEEEATSGAAYRLCHKARLAIYLGSPSWRKGPGASLISDETIEAQRQEFLANNGDEFGQLLTRKRNAS